jgi:hypothetical protein
MLLSFLLTAIQGYSQINDELKENQIEQVIESIAGSDEADTGNYEILDGIVKNSEHPLNINTASEEDLEQLNILDFNQIQNIILYRKQNGYFVSSFELAVVEGITPGIIESISPFITFNLPFDSIYSSPKKLYNSLMTRVKTSFPEARGYSSTPEGKAPVYPGMPISLYSRYQFGIPGRFELGLITDHDAGEQFFKGSNKPGFDYYSGFISWKGARFVRQVTVGDFLLRIGQGVNFGAGSGLGKSGNAVGIMNSGQGVRPSTSSDENRFFRGVATTLGYGPLRLLLFYSNKKRDANIISDKETGDTFFSSLQTSGYHRTVAEIADERSVGEIITGGYGEVKFRRFRIGLLLASQQFDLPMSAGTSPYKAKSFSGSRNFNIGVDYQLAFSHLQVFGEAGLSKSGKPGGVQGFVWHIHPQISWSGYFRFFDPGFHTFYGSSLSESSGNRNETGLYSGMVLYPLPRVKISCYIDFYHFPMLTYSTVAPESGIDYLVQVDVTLSDKLSLYLKGKYESKPQKLSGVQGVPADYDEMLTRLRIHGQYVINEKFTIRTRLEYSHYSFNNLSENGFLIFQDIVYSPFRKVRVWLRYNWFNTDGYNSRIYAYENDLLYCFSIPEFHGKGDRIYLNLKWGLTSRVTAYFKTGCTIHDGVSSWGSGNDVTDGNKRTELRGLLLFRF